MNRIQEFIDFMDERHTIYLQRQQGVPAPWTRDQALQRIYLTNVYRELDKVTIWVRDNIRDPYEDHENLWLMLVVARIINVRETLHDLIMAGAMPGDEWHPRKFEDVLADRMRAGLPTFTNAYMTWGGSEKGRPKGDLFSEMVSHLWDYREAIEPYLWHTLQDAHKTLVPQPGLGGFIAYEVVTDLRHTLYLRNAPDIMTWAHAGPGAQRGLNWVYGREPVERTVPRQQGLDEMRELLQVATEQWPHQPRLEMREIEHSLCEFSKVCAYRYHGKRPKRWYTKGVG